MSLPNDFQFSQNSLQDYTDCPRRFQLRYLLRQPWPAIESEPLAAYEQLLERGRRFHQLVERHNRGLPPEVLVQTIADPDLEAWWQNYLDHPLPGLPLTDEPGWAEHRRPEITLSTPLLQGELEGSHKHNYRLIARYDLLALVPGRQAIVVDWKTNQKRPTPATLAARLQTRVYRYVLVEAGTALNGGVPLNPEQVTMIYWFAEFPTQPEILPYDTAQHVADAADLTDLVTQINAHAAADEEHWPLTSDERHCRFCTYRSLCNRGALPGPLDEFDADQALDLGLDLAFEEIQEIAY